MGWTRDLAILAISLIVTVAKLLTPMALDLWSQCRYYSNTGYSDHRQCYAVVMAWTPPLGHGIRCARVEVLVNYSNQQGRPDEHYDVGLDLAKNLFQVHGVNERGEAVLRKKLKRADVASFFAKLVPCLIGMEACAGAHYWARKLAEFGHTVKLIAPQFVKPYVKGNKNDARDAEAICEAVSRPSMRFVPVKTVEQQAVLSLHRARQGFVAARTAQANQLRGLLSEFGIVIPKGVQYLAHRVPEILEDAENGLSGTSRDLFRRLFNHFRELDQQAKEMEEQIKAWHRENAESQRLEDIPGIGPLTATALVAAIGNASAFDNARQLAAWLGLVPGQRSSGGKEKLLGITKRGDVYLRTLLIHGARSVLLRLKARTDHAEGWLAQLIKRRHSNVAAVALANKNARIVWALLTHGREYQAGYVSARASAAN